MNLGSSFQHILANFLSEAYENKQLSFSNLFFNKYATKVFSSVLLPHILSFSNFRSVMYHVLVSDIYNQQFGSVSGTKTGCENYELRTSELCWQILVN